MKNKIKGLLALALAAFTSLTWAAELVIPYTFDGKAGNTDIPYEYKVQMPNTTLTSFTTTIRYAGGNHRVEIVSVKLLDGETTYTAVATGTEGAAAGTKSGSYSGGNSYNNVYTFTNEAGFPANKGYTLQAMLKVTENSPSHNGNIKVSGGITPYALPYAFGVNFTKDESTVTTDAVLGYTTEGYEAPAAWINVAGASGGYTSIAAPNARFYTLTWSANGGYKSGNAKDSDAKKLLYGYLDDVASSANARKKASVTITGLPADRKYAVAVILSGDGADGKDAFNNVYSPVLINGQTYSYDADGNLLTGEAAMAATTWGDRRANASTDGTLTIGKNVMFVEDLSGSELTITSALDAAQISRLTIAGIQVWISEETVTPIASASALPEGAEVISVNFNGGNTRGVSGEAGLYAVNGWNNLTREWGNGAEDKTLSATSLNISNGTSVFPSTASLAVTANNTYQWDDATDAFLKGYLDDGGNRAQVTLSNIPFEKYSVIVYTATDSGTNYRFATVQINNKVYIGTPYVTSIGYAAEVEGMGAIWGQACQHTAAYGVNALRVDGLSGNLSIQGGSNANNARGGIAAIQIVNTGDSILSDVQEIDWTEQAADQLKISELPTLEKDIVELTLADGAVLIVDEIKEGKLLNIISTGAVTIKVTNLNISQAQLNAMLNTNGVTGTVTNNYVETNGYTVGDATYPLVYLGGTDGWGTYANWATGTRTNGETTQWIAYTGTVVPGAPNSNLWNIGLVDGNLIGDKITADEETDYKVVNTPTLEGWAFKLAVANGVHVKIPTLNKLQGESIIRVDNTSKITVTNKGTGNNGDNNAYRIEAENGLVFENMAMPGGTAYLGLKGSITTGTFANNQTIGGVTLDLGDSTLKGRKVVTRTLYTYTSGTNFTVAEGAVTTSVETVAATEAVSLSNVGDYKFVKTDTSYAVNYVAYAATDEIGQVSTWTAKDGTAWSTEANWTFGVPEAGADAVISIATDTTITIPAEGVTVGVLTVNGEGTLTIAGGKITATDILANANITTDENTLALAPMNIAKGKTVTYEINTNGEQKVPALLGSGTFVKAGSGMLTMDKDSACDASITVNAGTLRFHAYAYDKTYNIVAKDGAKIQVGTWAGSLTSISNNLKLEGGAMLQLNNGNEATGAIIKGTIVIDSTAEKPAVIKGNNNGDYGVIAATIKGNGVLEIQDVDDNFFTISGVIANGDAEGDVLAVKVVTDRGVTFTGANTYTGGTVVAAGATLTVQKMSSLGAANTEVNIAKSGKVTVKSASNVTEDASVARAVFAGEGTVEFNGAGYYVLPNNFKAPAYLINNQADNLTIATDGTYDVGSYSGEKYFRMDYNQKGDRAFVITQRADATIESDIVQMFGSINNDQRLTDVTVKGVDGATLTLRGAHDNIHFRTLTIDATGSVNLAGGWKGNVVANGKLAGEGAIGGSLTLANGATLAGAVTVTGDVAIEGGLTIDHAKNAGDTVITCNNAADIVASLPTAPTDLKYAVDGNTVKLAVAKVNVTIPAAPANTKWYDANGNVVEAGTIAVDPNTDVTLTLKADDGKVFADGSTSKDYTVNSGETGASFETPDVTAATPVAQVGETKYQTFDAAFAAAQADATITLLAGVAINSRLDIVQNVTIDLNGQTIAETMEDQFGAIYVKKGATLTIATTNGGEITTDGGIVIGNYGTVIVNGGTIAAGDDAEADVSIYNFYYQADWYGTTTINGGTVARIWNCGVATLAGGEVTDVDNSGAMEITEAATVENIILRDGTDAPDIEGAGTLTAPAGLTVTTMDGQKVVYADGKYTVAAIPVSNNVAKIGETEYKTLQDALTAVATTADVEVTLINDTTENISIPADFNGTINLGGKTLTGYVKYIGNGADKSVMTLTNGSICYDVYGTAVVTVKKATMNMINLNVYACQYHGIRVENGGQVVINGGNYELQNISTSGLSLLYARGEGEAKTASTARITVIDGTFIAKVDPNHPNLKDDDPKTGAPERYIVNVNGPGREIYILGGTFEADNTATYNVHSYVANGVSAILSISGGIFYYNPATYVASGYLADTTIKSGYYTVDKAYNVAKTIDPTKVTVTGLNDAYACGGKASFTVAAVEGFNVTGVTLDGAALTPDENGKYTFTMPKKDVAIVVTTEAESTFDVMINGQPVADADALKLAANSTTTMTVPEGTWTAEGNVLKKDGEAYVTFADYYTVVVNGTSVTLKLNKPVIGESQDGADDAFTVTANAVTIKISNFNSALKYGVRSAANINSLKTAEIEPVTPTAGVITLEKAAGNSAFYEVVVSDVPFAE